METDTLSHTPAAATTIEATRDLALDDGTRPWTQQQSMPVPLFYRFERTFRDLTEIFPG